MKRNRTSSPALRSLGVVFVSLALTARSAAAQEAYRTASPSGDKKTTWSPEAHETTASELPCSRESTESEPPAVVKPGSDSCGAAGSYVPVPAAVVSCMQAETRQYLWELYQLGGLRPGTKLSAAQVESRILSFPIPVQMYAWPVYLQLGAENGQPWSGCAAGIAWQNEIWVSMRDGAERGAKLVAWETANNIVAWGLGRHDLGDSATVIGGATNRAWAVCTATPYAMR
ncbi:MAG: hypothetical protein U0529_18670 [Thermoanaerobaculia bacterium]